MNTKSFLRVPVLITLAVLSLVCFFNTPWFQSRVDVFRRLEWITYDIRARFAARSPQPMATNLAAVFLDETTAQIVGDGSLSYRANWPYPRHVHGRFLREMQAQGARAVAFDVLFGEPRPDDPPVRVPNQPPIDSDAFFAGQIRQSGNVILASQREVPPYPGFATNAWGAGDVSTEPDADGVLRRVKPFQETAGQRRWHLGIVLAARELGLNLERPVFEPGRIRLRGGVVERVIPLDDEGRLLIDWSLGWNDPRLEPLSYGVVLSMDELRQHGRPGDLAEFLAAFRASGGRTNLAGDRPYAGKLVVVGSTMVGGNLSDIGPTPLSQSSYLVSKHWNVANTVLTGRFVQPASKALEVLLILALGMLAAWMTRRLPQPWPSLAVLSTAALYLGLALWAYTTHRYVLPVVLPVVCALLMTHVCMVTYQVVFEQRERRRVRRIFAKLVSPEVVRELLQSDKLSLDGSRRKITVYFADVRGFTAMTNEVQAAAEEYVKAAGLTGSEAERYYDQVARETLETVSSYLAAIANTITQHRGTLDKYIGDCVMAFWGAPGSNPHQARDAVRSAIEAQRAIQAMNRQREGANERRQRENIARAAAGQPLLPLLPILSLGSGINTGTMVVGLMGSVQHGLNYTVFGREVNLASRLESVSGWGRIIIGENTWQDLQQDDPELAACCVALPPQALKGFQQPVPCYEVRWQPGKLVDG